MMRSHGSEMAGLSASPEQQEAVPAPASRLSARPLQPLLGVHRSVSGRCWLPRLQDDAAALALLRAHALPDALARVLAARGVDVAEAPRHLEPRLRDYMPPPDAVRDLPKAVGRLADAIINDEQVGIIGDYDVDGVSATTIVREFLQEMGIAPQVHIPHRVREGYGPSVEAVEALRENGASLLITLDCGAMAHDVLEHAAACGLETIVIDHHQMGTALPRAHAVVNPNRPDDDSGLGHLCAAGLAFMLVAATAAELQRRGHVNTRPDVLRWLDLVALATVCDVMPLQGLNRAYVRQGLKVLARRARPGLAALMDIARASRTPDAYTLGFVLGPRINAAGRIGHAADALKLLCAPDMQRAQSLAARLEQMNRERQELEQVLLEQALAQAEHQLQQRGRGVLLVHGEDWHAGVLGLVASRLKERFHLPAVALGTDPLTGMATGSARSVSGVDIGRAVARAVAAGVLQRGGGHAMAAGMALPAEGIERLHAFLNEELGEEIAALPEQPHLKVDAVLTAGGASRALLEELERAGPFGAGNPAPVFAFAAHRLQWVDVVGEWHLRCTLADGSGNRLRAIAFRAVDTPLGEALLNAREGGLWHIAGRLQRDDYNGRNDVQLHVIDAAAHQ